MFFLCLFSPSAPLCGLLITTVLQNGFNCLSRWATETSDCQFRSNNVKVALSSEWVSLMSSLRLGSPAALCFCRFFKKRNYDRIFKALKYHRAHDSLPVVQNFSSSEEATVATLLRFRTSFGSVKRPEGHSVSFHHSLFSGVVCHLCVCMCVDVFSWLHDSQLLLFSWRQSGAHACFALPALTHVFHLAICTVAWYI